MTIGLAMHALTDAEMAAALRLNFRQWKLARRKGLIPVPAICQPEERWTRAQLLTLLGESPPEDDTAAEVRALEAVERHAAKASRAS